LDIANIRERVIILILATSGLRVSTLSKLTYKHVKHDLENNIAPVCIVVNAEITKGKYHSYFTFLNHETADLLKAYLQLRKVGTANLPPEEINDESPLIRSANRAYCRSTVKPVTNYSLQNIIQEQYFKAGLITRGNKDKRYDLRVYSLRKFFRTELSARGVESDYIEFMMGHKISTYNDPVSKGIDYLRGVYLTAGLKIKPKEKMTKIDALKEIISSWGLDPKKILSQQIDESKERFGVEKSEIDYQI